MFKSKLNLTLVLMTLSINAFSAVNMHASYFLSYPSAVPPRALPDNQIVSIDIDHQQITLSTTNPLQSAIYSIITVDDSLNLRPIFNANFDMLQAGSMYKCSAFNLPLYVQGGSQPTQIDFICKK